MRLVKQSFLYFKEGNSDKVYEIDLCDVGNNKYVVNFRYGRKGSTLKEGSKTPVPVSLTEAEKIYDAVEQEKLLKGYTTSESGVSSISKTTTFKLNADVTISTDWLSMPNGRTKAILQRLNAAVLGNSTVARKNWKLSRVIWKAGEYKIKEAAPYIIKLFNNGNTVHQYSCTWALARCSNESAAKALQQIHNEHPSPVISKIAGVGLLAVLNGPEKESHLTYYINSLPEAIKPAIKLNQPKALDALLQERITQQQPQYNWLESLYLISVEKKWIRPLIKKILGQLPLKPGYFKHIRAIFKQAELLDDFEILGLLACRFEREQELFVHNIPSGDTESKSYIEEVSQYINPHIELKKKNTRLAYSQRTRRYLRGRVNRHLQGLGKTNNLEYVKLATAILIAYDRNRDFKEAFSRFDYKWNGRNYEKIETRFLQNAQAVFMHQILSGDRPELKLVSNSIWRLKSEQELQGNSSANRPAQAQTKQPDAGLFNKIAGLFGKKNKAPSSSKRNEEEETSPVNENGTPFMHLWNKLPQSYIQLLMEAQMDEIHLFAFDELTTHPAYSEIKQKLNKEACKKLLLSPFAIPAAFGFSITIEKYSDQADADLVMAMLNSANDSARNKGQQWTEANRENHFQQSDFIKDLIFAWHADIAQWAKEMIKNSTLSSDVKNAVTGKSIAELMTFTEMTATNEAIIKRAADTLFELLGSELQQVPVAIISDLLQHPVPPVLLFGLKILQAKKQQINPQDLNKSLLFGLLQHSYAPVRDMGVLLLSGMSDDALLKYQEEMMVCSISSFQNVRQGLAPVIGRMAQKEKAFGDRIAEMLMPYLLRKESSEGLHEDVSRLLCNELSGHLQNANKETALNLLYSNYAAAQNVGVVILEKYTDPAQLTIPQVIALGGHENLNVRSWCWNFYKEQASRIKYEKEAAVKLLESKWQDTRQFAMQYFRDYFTENDWSQEALITLADSIKPDVEAYGRELITRFFDGAQGTSYLLKLSQHPSEKMQLFATNYLERYAADDVAKIQFLEFYFRSVLTRVNKSRIAKNRIYHFLLTEGRKSEAAAKAVSNILSDISATAAIGDKAKCIEVLLQLKSLYEVTTPLQVKEIETRA
jgi:hypothetical protein